ncbi:hypothetical protein AB0N13_11365, partial [Streptomyces albogriseolus]
MLRETIDHQLPSRLVKRSRERPTFSLEGPDHTVGAFEPFPGVPVALGQLLRRLDGVGVEGAGQAAVAREEQNRGT